MSPGSGIFEMKSKALSLLDFKNEKHLHPTDRVTERVTSVDRIKILLRFRLFLGDHEPVTQARRPQFIISSTE